MLFDVINVVNGVFSSIFPYLAALLAGMVIALQFIAAPLTF